MRPFRTLDILQLPSPQPANPLINQQGEHIIYIGVFLIIVMAAVVVGILNQKVEQAIIFALLLSVVLIVLLMVA
jgi:uncharacterized membrane protein